MRYLERPDYLIIDITTEAGDNAYSTVSLTWDTTDPKAYRTLYSDPDDYSYRGGGATGVHGTFDIPDGEPAGDVPGESGFPWIAVVTVLAAVVAVGGIAFVIVRRKRAEEEDREEQ